MTATSVIVYDSMFQAQVLGQDQTPSAGDTQLVLRRLNRMLDSWSNEKQMISANQSDIFVMTANVGSYPTTILPNGRPIAINSMRVSLNNIDYPVDMIDQQKWNAIGYKMVPSIPNNCFYDATYPTGTMNFFPQPYGPFICTVDSQRPLTGTLTMTTDINLPEGYEAAIVAGLAVDISPSFGKVATAQMIADMRQTRAVIKRNNYSPLEMDLPFSGPWGGGLWGGDGIITGEQSGVLSQE